MYGSLRPLRSLPSLLPLLSLFLLGQPGCASRPILVPPPETEVLPPPLLFSGVRVFDGIDEELTPPVDVLVVNGKIAALAEPGTLKPPPGTVVIPGAGRTLLPGLVDMHLHLGGGDGDAPWDSHLPEPDAQVAALLYSGVTTVLNAGHEIDVEALWERIERGDLAGPRIYRVGRIITAPDGHPLPLLRSMIPWPLSSIAASGAVSEVADPAEASAATRDHLEYLRADFIKVVYDALPPGSPHLTREQLVAIVTEARQYEKRVVVHVGTPADAVEAAEAGAALLMHAPWDGPLTQDQADRIALTGVPVVTTSHFWAALQQTLTGKGQFTPLQRAVMRPGAFEAFAKVPEGLPLGDFSPAYIAELPRFDRQLGENLKLLRAAGVPLLAGTDSGLPAVFHGPALHQELAALVALGIPPAEVLRMATSMPARFLDPNAAFGVIAPRARADLLLVEGDPLQDITATQRIAGVWQGGRSVR